MIHPEFLFWEQCHSFLNNATLQINLSAAGVMKHIEIRCDRYKNKVFLGISDAGDGLISMGCSKIQLFFLSSK